MCPRKNRGEPRLCPLTTFPQLSADARVASRLNDPEHIVVSLGENSVKWLSCSNGHVMRDVDAQSVQVEFTPTESCSPCLSLHSVGQCTCLNRSSLICRLSGGPLSLFGEFYSPGPCQKIAWSNLFDRAIFMPVALRDSKPWTGPACVGYSTGCRGVGFGRV